MSFVEKPQSTSHETEDVPSDDGKPSTYSEPEPAPSTQPRNAVNKDNYGRSAGDNGTIYTCTTYVLL